MKKTLVLLFLVANLLAFMGVAITFLLSEAYPFHPGDLFYPLQDGAERTRLRLTSTGAAKADFALVLVERRVGDLAMADGAQAIDAGCLAFDRALRQAATYVEAAPAGAAAELQGSLERILWQADVVVATLGFKVDLSLLNVLHDKLQASLQAKTQPEKQEVLLRDIQAEAVPFYEADVDHTMFALVGGHNIDCQSCHQTGQYVDTSGECADCHSIQEHWGYYSEIYRSKFIARTLGETPSSNFFYPEHFEGACDDCHTVYSWEPETFNHKDVIECQSCHAGDLPLDQELPYAGLPHYAGDCLPCHGSVESWKEEVSFEHKDNNDCLACHQDETPENHYSTSCSNCHSNLEDWNAVVYEHSGDGSCRDCHWLERPMQHWDGECSRCHGTSDWIASYDHPESGNCSNCHDSPSAHYGGDCASCHKAQMDWSFDHPDSKMCANCHNSPDNHFVSNCTVCHITSLSWNELLFDHSENASCTSCHDKVTPEEHYLGECSDCHSTDGWVDYDFNHSYYPDCADCHTNENEHYPGECSNCHNTADWVKILVDHEVYPDCDACHTIENHYVGWCSNCHNTVEWEDYEMNHEIYTDCESCHEIEYHWPGQCSNCHTTVSWEEDIVFDHTGYTNCNSCHDRVHSVRGQCSKCHTTDTWLITTPTPTEEPEEVLTLVEETPEPVPTLEPSEPAPTPGPIDLMPTDEEEESKDGQETKTPEPTQDPELTRDPNIEEDPDPDPDLQEIIQEVLEDLSQSSELQQLRDQYLPN